MTNSSFSSIEARLAIIEDKVNTLAAVVGKYGLLSPDVVELKLSVSALTLVVSDEAARNSAVEVAQARWNAAHLGDELKDGPAAKDVGAGQR